MSSQTSNEQQQPKIVGKHTCTNCGSEQGVEVDPNEVMQAMQRPSKVNFANTGTTYYMPKHQELDVAKVVEQKLNEKKETEKKQKELEKRLKTPPIPSYIPKFRCNSGRCDLDGLHKNPNYRTRPKSKCTKCDQYNPVIGTEEKPEKCLWCGNDDLEEVEEEELEELGIPLPNLPTQDSHNHHHRHNQENEQDDGDLDE